MPREILLVRDRLNNILAKHTGQPVERIAEDTERDNFMSGEESRRLRPDRPGAGAPRGE